MPRRRNPITFDPHPQASLRCFHGRIGLWVEEDQVLLANETYVPVEQTEPLCQCPYWTPLRPFPLSQPIHRLPWHSHAGIEIACIQPPDCPAVVPDPESFSPPAWLLRASDDYRIIRTVQPVFFVITGLCEPPRMYPPSYQPSPFWDTSGYLVPFLRLYALMLLGASPLLGEAHDACQTYLQQVAFGRSDPEIYLFDDQVRFLDELKKETPPASPWWAYVLPIVDHAFPALQGTPHFQRTRQVFWTLLRTYSENLAYLVGYPIPNHLKLEKQDVFYHLSRVIPEPL